MRRGRGDDDDGQTNWSKQRVILLPSSFDVYRDD